MWDPHIYVSIFSSGPPWNTAQVIKYNNHLNLIPIFNQEFVKETEVHSTSKLDT